MCFLVLFQFFMTRGSSSKVVASFNDTKSKFHKRKKDNMGEEFNLDKLEPNTETETEREASEPEMNKRFTFNVI